MQEASAERGLESRLASHDGEFHKVEVMLTEESENIMRRYTAQILVRSGEQRQMEDKFNELWRFEQPSKLTSSFKSSG
jgi:hypothetical protein